MIQPKELNEKTIVTEAELFQRAKKLANKIRKMRTLADEEAEQREVEEKGTKKA